MPRRPLALAGTVLLAVVAALATTVGTATAAKKPTGTPIRIGLEAPLTGDQSTLGQGMLLGARLAAEQVNAKGGVDGRPVEIVQIDDAGVPATGVTAATAAIAAGLDGVVGPYNSSVGLQTLPRYIAAGLVPVRLTSADATEGLGVTLQPMTRQIAPVASKALVSWLDANAVAIAYDDSQVYTRSVATALKQNLEASGARVTAFTPFQPGAQDYTTLVTGLLATNPEAVYFAAYYPEGGLMAQAMTNSGSKTPCIADYASYDQGYIQTAGPAAAPRCSVVGVPAPEEFPGAAKYVKAYRKQFAQAPGSWSPYTYDSVRMLLDAADHAGGFGAAGLAAALKSITYSGWTGSVTIDPSTGDREPATVVVLDVVKGKGFVIDGKWSKAVRAGY